LAKAAVNFRILPPQPNFLSRIAAKLASARFRYRFQYRFQYQNPDVSQRHGINSKGDISWVAKQKPRVPGRQVASHNVNMSAEQNAISPGVLRRVMWIQTLTLIWMSVEAVVSLGAAWIARSPALLAFGGDSAMELLSAAVVFRRFYSPSGGEHAEERAGRIAGGLLFLLAAFVASASILSLLRHREARPSPFGIALLLLAAMIMPWLAAQKRQLSIATASAALRADAAESAVCGYLALIALAGLVVNAVWKVSWADPVAALGLLPLIVREGWEASKGRPCCS
jgi:Co/Zn/Cd efflux system component